MQQQIQLKQPADQVLNDASAFFARRRAKIRDRSDRGFRFGLEGVDEGGRVSVAPGRGGTCTVTVEAEGLAVMAIADSFVRELRKQSREHARATDQSARSEGGASATRGGFGDLRARLGMPPAPRRPAPTSPRGPAGEAPAQAAGVAGTVVPSAAGPVRPDGPLPTEAPQVSPETGPQSPPAPAQAEVAAPHPAHVGPPAPDDPAEGKQRHAPAIEALSSTAPSAEQTGGVPDPGAVTTGEPSKTALASAAAGSPATPPVTDPSQTTPAGPADRNDPDRRATTP